MRGFVSNQHKSFNLAKNTGKEYEQFVAELQQALLNTEAFIQQKNVKVEVNKIIVDNCGIKRQFDIYWEYELGGITYKTVIECKDYNSKISVDRIDGFIGKIRDIPDLKPVFATKKGYQSGSKLKAEQSKIDLLIVREQNDTDWTSEDGTPLIKKISINMNVCRPAQIQKFEPLIDANWAKENTALDLDGPVGFSGQNNEIFIEDKVKNEQVSLYDLASQLKPLDDKEYGTFEQTEKLENAFIHHGDLTFKLAGYKVEYSIPKPIAQLVEVDGSKELIGVIEYLQKGTKKSIFRDGVVR